MLFLLNGDNCQYAVELSQTNQLSVVCKRNSIKIIEVRLPGDGGFSWAQANSISIHHHWLAHRKLAAKADRTRVYRQTKRQTV